MKHAQLHMVQIIQLYKVSQKSAQTFSTKCCGQTHNNVMNAEIQTDRQTNRRNNELAENPIHTNQQGLT